MSLQNKAMCNILLSFMTTQSVNQHLHSGACLPFRDATNRDHVARLHDLLHVLKCAPLQHALVKERANLFRLNFQCCFGLLAQGTLVCSSRLVVILEH